MGTNQINALILYKGQISCITLVQVYTPICAFMLKVYFFSAPFQCHIVNIHTDNIPVQQLCLYQRRAASGKLIKYQVVFF